VVEVGEGHIGKTVQEGTHKNPHECCRWNEEIPAPLKQLVERCWDMDYDKRPNFDEICDILEAEARKLGGRSSASTQKVAGEKPGGDHSGTGCCFVM